VRPSVGPVRLGAVALLVVVVGTLARSPATVVTPAPTDESTGVPFPAPPPSELEPPTVRPVTPPSQTQDPDASDLDDGLPGPAGALSVVEGSWVERPIMIHGAPVADGVAVDAVWQGSSRPEVVVVAGMRVAAYDPVSDRWRDLPALPEAISEASARQLVAAVGRVYVAGPPVAVRPDVTVTPAWLLHEDGWTSAPAVTGGIIGTCCGGRPVVVHASTSPRDTAVGSTLSVIDPLTATITRLPDPPMPIEVTAAVEVDGGFVAFGLGLDDRRGPRRLLALRWSQRTVRWTALRDPPAPLVYGIEIPVADGRDATRLLSSHTEPDPPALHIVSLDLDQDVWVEEAVLSLDEADIGRGGLAGLRAAWDGDQTVWFHGGYPEAVLLSLDLGPSGAVAVGRGGVARTPGQVVWHAGRLIAYGGFGRTGQATTISIWQPGDSTVEAVDAADRRTADRRTADRVVVAR
jgi:hypothetical protein